MLSHADQKKMIDELSKRNELTQGSLDQKCTEMKGLEAKVAGLMEDKEKLQSRVTRANELLKLMTSALCHGEGEGNANANANANE